MSGDKKMAAEEANEAKQEIELEESLARLNQAYHQLTEARRTIDRMLLPLHAAAADPELVYSAFAQSAQKAVGDVKEFQAAIRDPKLQELLIKSRKTIKEVGGADGVETWLGGLNEDWAINENTGAAVDGLDSLKIERDTPNKT